MALFAVYSGVAEAKVYEQFKIECDLGGTEQTLWSTQNQLPNLLRLKVEFAKETGNNNAEVVRTAVFTSNGDPVAFENDGIAFAPYAQEYCNSAAFNHMVSLQDLTLSPAFARELLILMGAIGVPDLSGLYPKGKIEFGSVGTANASCTSQWTPDRILGQIHFDKNFRDGLSYHLILKTCQVTYRAPGGAVASTGYVSHIGPKPAPRPAPVPGRKGD